MKTFPTVVTSTAVVGLIHTAYGALRTQSLPSINAPQPTIYGNLQSNLTFYFATPVPVPPTDYNCDYEYIPCGPLCCQAGQQCTWDIIGNLACCSDSVTCYGSLTQTVASRTIAYTTNTPANAAGRTAHLAIFGQIAALARSIYAMEPRFDDNIVTSTAPSTSSEGELSVWLTG